MAIKRELKELKYYSDKINEEEQQEFQQAISRFALFESYDSSIPSIAIDEFIFL